MPPCTVQGADPGDDKNFFFSLSFNHNDLKHQETGRPDEGVERVSESEGRDAVNTAHFSLR
jgi:hypothetical protein